MIAHGIRLTFVVLMGLALGSQPAGATVVPSHGPEDGRLRIVHYDPNQVVLLEGTLGYQMSLEFGTGERIQNISIGDSLGWQVTPNRRGDLLFLKPQRRNATTNMVVYTNLRRYMFDLRVRSPRGAGDRSIIFDVHFDYPNPRPASVAQNGAPQTPANLNHAYSFSGSKNNLPSELFDDGQRTYFAFPDSAAYPAIFALDSENHEALVNANVRDGYVVVDEVARGFVLRRGHYVTRIKNDAFNEPQPGPLAPKPE